jgi:DNA-binding response OmpR family regulator
VPVARSGRSADLKRTDRKKQGLPERVLVVEDDPDTRQFLVTAIAEEGYEPIAALDGWHALRTLLAIEPSAIVLDLMLPGLDGEDFVRAFRRLHRQNEPPIVVVSARHDAAAVGKQLGARAVFPKPLDVTAFLASLTETIRGHRQATA